MKTAFVAFCKVAGVFFDFLFPSCVYPLRKVRQESVFVGSACPVVLCDLVSRLTWHYTGGTDSDIMLRAASHLLWREESHEA